MAGVNKVILIGNLGRDPELTYTQSGMAICKVSIATSDKRKDGTEATQWHRCVAFERRAEVIAQYFRKGSKIYIEGKLSYGQHEKDGIKHYTADIIISSFEFLESRGEGGQGGGYQKPPQQVGGYAPPGGYHQPPQNPYGPRSGPDPTRAPSPPYGYGGFQAPIDSPPPDDDVPF